MVILSETLRESYHLTYLILILSRFTGSYQKCCHFVNVILNYCLVMIVGCRSETDIINVVEQRIWHSMEQGQFENLPGKGKPLDLSSNPHADPAEDTLYRILSRNKCAPEWVELNKEIRDKVAVWRSSLKKAWGYRSSGNDAKWVEYSEALKLQLRDINDKVRDLSHWSLLCQFAVLAANLQLCIKTCKQTFLHLSLAAESGYSSEDLGSILFHMVNTLLVLVLHHMG